MDAEGSAVQKISSGQIPDTWTKGHGKFGPVWYAPLIVFFSNCGVCVVVVVFFCFFCGFFFGGGGG